MATASDLDRVSMVVLRYMRGPFFALLFVYAIGILGMSLIPGYDADGNEQRMSLFHSFYFFTYTATTTGFGEIPQAFSDEQRLWAIFCLYTGVIAWLYAIGSIIRLLQNPYFLLAISEYRFTRTVKGLSDSFFIICGFGDTGSLLARGLSDHHMRAVIIDDDLERIKALSLRDYNLMMPGLCADASNPKHLVNAGIERPNCKAIIILTNNENNNLKIAVMARFLNQSVRVICRSTTPRYERHLKELDNVTVIDPFEIFAQLLSMSIQSPALHNLNSWLVRAKGTRLGEPINAPKGHWILCGYGRMGQWLHNYFKKQAIQSTIIDPKIDPGQPSGNVIATHADHQALIQADIENAVGIVAGTNSDTDNLSILLCAQSLNPDIFSIARQNKHEDQLAFDAAQSNLTLQPSLTTARRILKILISPMVQSLIDDLLQRDESYTQHLNQRLIQTLGHRSPHLWCVTLSKTKSIAAHDHLVDGKLLKLHDIMKDPRDSKTSLSCVAFMINRGGQYQMLPDDSHALMADDEILFCGTSNSKQLLTATLNNAYTLHYLITGHDLPRGYFFSWWSNRNSATPARPAPGSD